jgi:CDP-diacylglycerol--glycerol-3-phosphate 3-phosphatidyltransferase
MNLPNQLTILRLILTLLFLAAMSMDFPAGKMVSLLIFSTASFTDFLDGYIARKYNLITNFGKLMDPLVDKILMTGGFVMLVASGHIPGWIVVIILAREFMVTGLRLIASAEGKVLAAENLGKYKTIIQIVTIIYFLLYLAATETGSPLGGMSSLFGTKVFSPDTLGQFLVWGSLILTLLSGFNYTWKNRDLIKEC